MATKKTEAKKVEAVVADPVEEKPAPKPKYDPADNSIDARMWRLEQDHKRMGSR